MGLPHLVKIGLMEVVGHYSSPDFQRYPRDARVICRTDRGLEQGVVVCELSSMATPESGERTKTEGHVLRLVGSEDELILQRLERYRDKAFLACQKLIAEQQLPAILVDVEHLFDGESVFFYFIGDVDERLESLTAQLGETYESKVRFKKFAETLAQGCGPNCGEKEGGCSSGGCGSCALAGSCKS
jgi:cell fate regulator YaaT (PSP1 superfamily)